MGEICWTARVPKAYDKMADISPIKRHWSQALARGVTSLHWSISVVALVQTDSRFNPSAKLSVYSSYDVDCPLPFLFLSKARSLPTCCLLLLPLPRYKRTYIAKS